MRDVSPIGYNALPQSIRANPSRGGGAKLTDLPRRWPGCRTDQHEHTQVGTTNMKSGSPPRPLGAPSERCHSRPLRTGKRGAGQAKPHLKEALLTLQRLKRQRDLSEREMTRAGALGMLLSSIEGVR